MLVTLFGTAISLGIGALQIRTGTSLLTGKEIRGNAFLVGAMVLLTVVFIFSAVSGIKRGIRMHIECQHDHCGGIGCFRINYRPHLVHS
nr:BCCT family transporter [Corynebacterium kroppenstedtii]